MALILSRIMPIDLARFINDKANKAWREEKQTLLKKQLFNEIFLNCGTTTQIEYNHYDVIPDDILHILGEFESHNIIDDEVREHVKEWSWVYRYFNKYNDGPLYSISQSWVPHEIAAFDGIFQIIGLDSDDVEQLLKDIR